MRIKKVDLVAKGLRSFATFTEAAVPGSASRCDSGKGISCRGNEVVALRTSATFSKNQMLQLLAGIGREVFWIGGQKKPTTFLLWVQLKEKLFR